MSEHVSSDLQFLWPSRHTWSRLRINMCQQSRSNIGLVAEQKDRDAVKGGTCHI